MSETTVAVKIPVTMKPNADKVPFGWKRCPSCGDWVHGRRSSICACGHVFQAKTAKVKPVKPVKPVSLADRKAALMQEAYNTDPDTGRKISETIVREPDPFTFDVLAGDHSYNVGMSVRFTAIATGIRCQPNNAKRVQKYVESVVIPDFEDIPNHLELVGV